jgi:hypothetical protein
MKFWICVTVMLTSLCCGSFAQSTLAAPKSLGAPAVPASIALPDSQAPVFRVHAKGFQNYTCANAGGTPKWTLTGPEAQLLDDDSRQVGTHYAVRDAGSSPSPGWRLSDGSEIVGAKVAGVDAPDGQGVQWLLLKVVKNDKRGVLADVTSVQRVNTAGGKPPESGCTTTDIGKQEHSPYTADYYFAK